MFRILNVIWLTHPQWRAYGQREIQCCQPPGHPFAYRSDFFEDFAPNLRTTFSRKRAHFFLQIIIKYDVTKSNKTRMDTEVASTRNEITIQFICIRHKNARQTKIYAKTDTGIVRTIIKKRLVQQSGWHNLQYANGGPLLLAVIPGGRVQEDKNLAGFLFAVGSILFFQNCRNFRRADEDAFFRKNTEGWQHWKSSIDTR